MRILIANYDFIGDGFTIPFSEEINRIRRSNLRGYNYTEIFDPYGEEGECTLGCADKIFGYARAGLYNGIITQESLDKDVFTRSDGYPAIDTRREVFVNPIYMPILSQDTLVAYMPQIPWDEFGDHLRLEGDDAEQFVELWNTFLQQNKDFYNAMYRHEYPVDESISNLGYIFMEKEIE